MESSGSCRPAFGVRADGRRAPQRARRPGSAERAVDYILTTSLYYPCAATSGGGVGSHSRVARIPLPPKSNVRRLSALRHRRGDPCGPDLLGSVLKSLAVLGAVGRIVSVCAVAGRSRLREHFLGVCVRALRGRSGSPRRERPPAHGQPSRRAWNACRPGCGCCRFPMRW
jgi:hypothetical protein